MIHFSLCYCANVLAGVKIKKFGDLQFCVNASVFVPLWVCVCGSE